MTKSTPRTDDLFDNKCGRMDERQCAFTLLEHARQLERELDEAEERERMRLCAISVLSTCNTRESAASQRLPQDNPYWTPTLDDVCKAVDREMAERDRAEALQRELADADKLLETVRVAMGTTTVMEGLNVIDGLRVDEKALLDDIERLVEEAYEREAKLLACENDAWQQVDDWLVSYASCIVDLRGESDDYRRGWSDAAEGCIRSARDARSGDGGETK